MKNYKFNDNYLSLKFVKISTGSNHFLRISASLSRKKTSFKSFKKLKKSNTLSCFKQAGFYKDIWDFLTLRIVANRCVKLAEHDLTLDNSL